MTASLERHAIRTDDSRPRCREVWTHEEVSTRKADGLVVAANDSAVDAVRELIDVLCEDP